MPTMLPSGARKQIPVRRHSTVTHPALGISAILVSVATPWSLWNSLTHLVKQLADWSLDHCETIGRSRADYDAQYPRHEMH